MSTEHTSERLPRGRKRSSRSRSPKKDLPTPTVRERSNSIKLDVGEYLANGEYGIVTHTQTSVFKILKNFRHHDEKKKDKNKHNFEREISITKLLHNSEEKSHHPNPFVAIKNVYKDVEIDLTTFKDKLYKDQQGNFDTVSPVIVYEMDNAGIPLLDYLESKHESVCKCGDKLKCDIYTRLEVDIILKLAKLLDYLQKKYKFVHGDLSYSNVMVSVTGDLVLIDIGSAYMIKDGKVYICETKYGAKCFNDRRDLFTFLTSLMDSSNFSKKLTEFIEYLPSWEDEQTFSSEKCRECDDGIRRCGYRHKIIWDNRKIANDSEYGILDPPEKCLLFTPEKVTKLFELFRDGRRIDNKDIGNSFKLPIIEKYKKDVDRAIQLRATLIATGELIKRDTIETVCNEINSMYSGWFIPEKLKEEKQKFCKEKLEAALENKSMCTIMFKSSKKTPKKSSKKTSKKTPKKTSKKTPKKTPKKTSKKTPKKTPKKTSKKT